MPLRVAEKTELKQLITEELDEMATMQKESPILQKFAAKVGKKFKITASLLRIVEQFGWTHSGPSRLRWKHPLSIFRENEGIDQFGFAT